MKKLWLVVAAVLALSLVGCGRVGTNEVGVRTDFNKKIDMTEVPQGWYGAFFTSVTVYSTREIPIEMQNMTPKAKDNLRLQDLDVTIYYLVKPDQVAEVTSTYLSQSAMSKNGDHLLPAYHLVENIANSVIQDAVSKIDSLAMHTQRTVLESSIKSALQKELDGKNPNTFTITQVAVKKIQTDSTIEASIQANVAKQKLLEQKDYEIQIAKKDAIAAVERAKGIHDANMIINNSLTREYLQHESNLGMLEFAKSGSHTVVIPANMSNALISIPGTK